jgi:hypothetical protein
MVARLMNASARSKASASIGAGKRGKRAKRAKRGKRGKRQGAPMRRMAMYAIASPEAHVSTSIKIRNGDQTVAANRSTALV